jgi:hypothetical protein
MTLARCVTLAAFSPMRHSLGKVVTTAAVAASVPESVIVGLLDRHSADDWGDVDAEDKAANTADHRHAEGRLFSSYDTPEHGTIWVIKENLRGEGGSPATNVLFRYESRSISYRASSSVLRPEAPQRIDAKGPTVALSQLIDGCVKRRH